MHAAASSGHLSLAGPASVHHRRMERNRRNGLNRRERAYKGAAAADADGMNGVLEFALYPSSSSHLTRDRGCRWLQSCGDVMLSKRIVDHVYDDIDFNCGKKQFRGISVPYDITSK